MSPDSLQSLPGHPKAAQDWKVSLTLPWALPRDSDALTALACSRAPQGVCGSASAAWDYYGFSWWKETACYYNFHLTICVHNSRCITFNISPTPIWCLAFYSQYWFSVTVTFSPRSPLSASAVLGSDRCRSSDLGVCRSLGCQEGLDCSVTTHSYPISSIQFHPFLNPSQAWLYPRTWSLPMEQVT